jgi:hypothetical protein
MQGCELFVTSNTCLILCSGRGGESVPKELRSRAFKADIGLPEWRRRLEGSRNCGKMLAILENSNRESASAIQLSREDSHVACISMLSSVVTRKRAWRRSMAGPHMDCDMIAEMIVWLLQCISTRQLCHKVDHCANANMIAYASFQSMCHPQCERGTRAKNAFEENQPPIPLTPLASV